MFQHRIENRQQLAHTGSEGHLLRLFRSLQALIEGPERKKVPGTIDCSGHGV